MIHLLSWAQNPLWKMNSSVLLATALWRNRYPLWIPAKCPVFVQLPSTLDWRMLVDPGLEQNRPWKNWNDDFGSISSETISRSNRIGPYIIRLVKNSEWVGHKIISKGGINPISWLNREKANSSSSPAYTTLTSASESRPAAPRGWWRTFASPTAAAT